MDIIPTNPSSFEEIVNKLITDIKIKGLEDIGKFLERMDTFLYSQKPSYMKVVKIKERTIQTTIGMLHFKRRYYFDELEGKYRYLLDAYLSIPKRNRFMDAVKIKIIEAASIMSYRNAGIYGCEEGLPASKSTVYRLIRKSLFYFVDNDSLVVNDDKVHIQIDEKYMNVIGSKNQKKFYTGTIFKGVTTKGKKRILQNRMLVSSDNLSAFFKKINRILIKKYKVKLEDEVFLSGDLATYIQNAPDKIMVCKAIYVPDKFHIEHAIKEQTGIIVNETELNDRKFQEDIIKCLEDNNNTEAKKITKLLKKTPSSLTHYLDPKYEGCSQECMNSHYYATRFDKVPNKWNMKTIVNLSMIIEAKNNGSKIKIGFKDEYYDMPYKERKMIDIEKEIRNPINTDGMPYHMKKLFNRIEDGYDGKLNL